MQLKNSSHIGHVPGGPSLINTISPSFKFGCASCHFFRGCKEVKKSEHRCLHARHEYGIVRSPIRRLTGMVEDFGKRNIPAKRARRHFSLSKFERGLIIGMKTAGWSTRRVAGQVDRLECVVRNCWEQWTREGTHAWKTGSRATRKTTRRED
ncbi:uncharacterized protein TNCV_1617211 [Trichonephila clavipes]|nr:uncharacterized protein TNCV_1617211 [Trichonephila clavipes]